MLKLRRKYEGTFEDLHNMHSTLRVKCEDLLDKNEEIVMQYNQLLCKYKDMERALSKSRRETEEWRSRYERMTASLSLKSNEKKKEHININASAPPQDPPCHRLSGDIQGDIDEGASSTKEKDEKLRILLQTLDKCEKKSLELKERQERLLRSSNSEDVHLLRSLRAVHKIVSDLHARHVPSEISPKEEIE
jgi:hypothetical protein